MEITPEMIARGANVLVRDYDFSIESACGAVEEVLEAVFNKGETHAQTTHGNT